MDFSKVSVPIHCPEIPESLMELQRMTSPHPNGGFEVCFVQVPSSDLAKEVLDPREITLEFCIENNLFIEPKEVQKIFNISDPSDIETVAGRVSENMYKYIMDNEPNFNYEKNTIINPKSE